ncbi:B12-binding domain-containing radical SAM protein, partial [Patescibacteria group bacterium]|nr:B12-binding domain-containing radical SAM protein [Patescibacteria group bacterium]
MKKLLMIIFTENSNIGASILCSLAREYGWDTDIYFVPPNLSNIDNENNIKLFIDEYKPDLISFTFKSFERIQALYLAKMLKSNLSIKIIAGGVHPTLMPEDVAIIQLFDTIIVGDGMGIWKDVLDNYNNYDNLNGKNIIYGKSHPRKELYTNYFHSKSQIERMKSTETANILTAIGCMNKCNFCHSGNQKFFPMNIENVAQCVIDLYNKYDVRNFHFLDDLFSYNLKRLQKFREIIKESGLDIKFSSQISGMANVFNKEIAEELVKLGVETVNFGIETASPKLLKFLNKKQSVEDCYNAVQICHDFKLNCVINLMFGIPTQNEDDYECTLEFVKRAKPDSVSCFFYTPYPGTKLYDYCFDYKYLPESFDRNKFDWFKPCINGISDVQLKLNNIDYELANMYIEKIHEIVDNDKLLLKKMKIIDLHPWIIVGTSRHYY